MGIGVHQNKGGYTMEKPEKPRKKPKKKAAKSRKKTTKAKAAPKEPAKMGRPTDYRPEYCQQIIEYFSVEPYREVEVLKHTNNGPYTTTEFRANDFPSFAGFCSKIGTSRVTMLEWCKKHPDFLNAYRQCKELQEHFMLINGLKGTVNTHFSIFAAKNLLSYTDKKDPDTVIYNDNSTRKYNKMSEEELEAEVKKRAAKLLAKDY